MKAKDWLKRMKSGRNRRFSSIGCSVISMLVCVAILVTSNAFVFPSIALAGAADEAANAEASANGVQAENRRNDAVTQSADASAEDQLNERLNTLVSSVSLMKQDSAAAAKAKKTAEVASTGAGEYAARLTDRSNDIGVKSEGYEDSPYNFEKTYSGGVVIGYNLWVPDTDKRTGGTVYIGNSATGRPLKLWQAEQYWDGEAPFRITSVDSDQRTYDFQTYNDFTLEDDVAPNGAFKLDHLDLEFSIVSLSSKQNIYARGNKLVIGESVTTKSGGQWRIYGGTEHAHLNDTDGRPLIDTNVVVASGNWDYVFGGGEGPTGRGTQVTIRGNANVTNVYGGGERKGSIGLTDYNERNTLQTNGNGINVYVEDGTVGNIWGGSAINSNQYSLLGLAANIPLPIYEDISINVSGGQIGRIVAASDASDGVTLNYSHFNESNIHGDAIINITGGSVSKAVGDPNRNTPNTATDHRMVLGATRMNISESNDFDYFDLFDLVNITGKGTANSVVVSTASKAGETFTDTPLTFWSSSNNSNPQGFIGSIRVADGGKLVLNKGGTINKAFDHYVGNTYQYNAYEGNTTLKGSRNGTIHYISKAWIGETSEARRSLSTLAIDGSATGANISAASASSFTDGTDRCGLRIHGNVQGEIAHSFPDYSMNVPGYSTLEVVGDPIYSTGDKYYYYVVADSSANGGKAFREPAGAPYIVCYRYLDNGKIGWYLRQKPEISVLDNKLVRAGDAENGVMQMHVAMNGFGFEWDRDETKCTADFKITKYTGTAADPTPVSANITLAMLSALQAGDSGNFRNVTFGTQDGITYLQSFDYIIDNSTPVDPTYYEVSADYHVIRTDDNYEDWRDVDAKNAARCVYDFAGNDDLHSKDGYSDSVMDTIPYAAAPAGADNALLRVYLPYGVTGKLNIAENDGSFQFTDNSTASLESSTTVTSSYGTAAEAYANSHFGVTIGGNELAGGISDVAISNAVSTYLCTVYSYKNVSISDITKNTADGLQLNLSLADLTKDGNGVGTSDPAAVNNGELQIRVTGTFKITYRFTTRTQGERDYVYTGKMSDVLNENGVGSDGLLTDVFVAAHAPYESNHGKTFTWLTDSITKASADGVLTALVLSSQTDKVVHVNYCTTSGGMSQAFEAPIGANRLNNTDVAQINASGDNFRYWEIRKSSSASAPVIAKCYDAEFSFCMMDDYWITPVFDTDTGKTVKLDPEALQNGDEKWLAWTWNDDTDGVQITPSADLTFTGLKDNVIFARINKDYNDLGTGWSNVWNKTYNLEVVDGATYTLMSWGDYYETGKSYMNGTWSGITLTFLDYTRNRWTDSEGAASPNGRSDYLYSDFEIAYSDELKDIYGSDTGYTTGVVFEYCRALYDEETFNPAADYDSGIAIDRNALKLAITNNSSSYAANENLTRRIQRTAIPTATLTNKNRIEFGKSYYNTLANSKAIMKVTAYLIDSSGNVTLSNPVFVCLKETSQRDLAIPAGN